MPNITISIEEQLLKSGRKYAEEHQTSINALIRNLLGPIPVREENVGSARNSTMSKVFLDTNILVYSLDQADAAKKAKCRGLIRSLTVESKGVISTQVMQEFYVAATGKLGADPLLTKDILRSLERFETVVVSPSLIKELFDHQPSIVLGCVDHRIR